MSLQVGIICWWNLLSGLLYRKYFKGHSWFTTIFTLLFSSVYLNYYRPIFCKKSFGHIPSNSNCFIYPERFQGSANPWNQKARAKGSRSLRRIHETSRSIPSEANLWESVTNGRRRFEKPCLIDLRLIDVSIATWLLLGECWGRELKYLICFELEASKAIRMN